MSLLPELPPRGNALRTFRLCGTQRMPERSGAGLLPTGRFAIPTKTPLAFSQFFGRLGSFLRVPLQVLSTSLPGRAWFWYLFQLMRMQSRLSLSFRVAIMRLRVSWGGGVLFRDSSFSSRSLLQRAFHRRNAHSDAAIRKRRVAPVLILPFADLIFRRGRAMIEVISKSRGQGMCFNSQSSFTTSHA